jgi:hypothetical protein
MKQGMRGAPLSTFATRQMYRQGNSWLLAVSYSMGTPACCMMLFGDIQFSGDLCSSLSGPFLFCTWSGFLDHSMRCAAAALAALAAACWPLPAAQQFRRLCSSAAVVSSSGCPRAICQGKAAAVSPDAADAAQTGGGGGEGSGVDQGFVLKTTTRWSSRRQQEPAGLELDPRTRMRYHM